MRVKFGLWDLARFNADAGGGAGGAGDGGQGGAGGAPGGDGGQGGAPGGAGGDGGQGAAGGGSGGEWKLPEGLPDKFKVDSRDKFEATLLQDWKRLEGEVRSRPQVGKDVNEYLGFKPSEKIAPIVGDLSKDPIFSVAAEQAFKAGVPTAHFHQFIDGLYTQLAEQGALPPAFDPAAENLAFLGPEARGKTEAQVQEMIKPFRDTADATVKEFAATAKLDKDDVTTLQALQMTASGLRILNALGKAIGTPGLRPGGDAGGGSITAADLRARAADPRGDRNSTQFDRAFAEETDRLYKQVYR